VGVQFLRTQTEQLIHFPSIKHLPVCHSHFASAPGQTIMLKGDIKIHCWDHEAGWHRSSKY